MKMFNSKQIFNFIIETHETRGKSSMARRHPGY